ncbi:MAG: hypothetical protein JOY96_05250, partial [Verrucomicrobia bacterium]|nr:hypothetical protein [Verrucomicrobiota bacterium]
MKLWFILIFALGADLTSRAQDVPRLIAEADRLDDRGETDSAILTLKEAEKISPKNPDVLIRLSQDYSDKLDAAREGTQKVNYAKLSFEYAKAAVREAPNSPEAHNALAIAYGKMTDFVDNRTKIEYSKIVKSEAEKSLSLKSKNATALLILARWNLDMATLNPILKVFAQALYGQLPDASKELALEYFRRAIAISPDRLIL